MQTQDITAQLEQIMQSLHQQGKQPTVALVKARLTTPVPMPAIIAAVKGWSNNQNIPKIEIAAEQEEVDKIARLEQKIIELTARIEALEARQ